MFVDHLFRSTEDIALFSRLGLSIPPRVEIEQEEQNEGFVFDDGLEEESVADEDECEVNMDDL